MPALKLAKLPDRTPVKLAITVSPDLYHDLRRYADLYHAQFGQPAPVTELIPYMLADFLGSDRGFAQARKDGMAADPKRRSDETARQSGPGPETLRSSSSSTPPSPSPSPSSPTSAVSVEA